MSALDDLIPTNRPPIARTLGVGIALPMTAAVLLACLMQFVAPSVIGEYGAAVAVQVGIAVMLAVSLNIVNGYTGQFSIGHAGFFAVGAYVAAAMSFYIGMLIHKDIPTVALGGGFLGTGQLVMLLGLGCGALVAAGLGYLVGLPSLRLRGDYLAIVTLGFGEIVRVLLTQTKSQVFDHDELMQTTLGDWVIPPLGGATGFAQVPKHANLWWIWFFVAVVVFFAYRVKVSSTGRALLSIREDEIAARSMGVNITMYKVRAFVLAAALAGVAGGLYAHSGVTLMPKDAGFMRSFDAVIFVVLGGMGSISGVVLAAIVLTVLPEVLRQADQYRMIFYALLLIIMMITRPKGLFGVKEIWEIWGAKKAAKGGAA